MPEDQITVYGTDWCGDCRRAVNYLKQNQIPFTWINIDNNQAAELYVLKINQGYRSVPTILFSDGSVLVEPSNEQLAAKINSSVRDESLT